MKSMHAVMVSVVGREEVRWYTLDTLRASGINPEVFISPQTPANREKRLEEIRRNVSRALRAGYAAGTSYVLYCEDDIIAASVLAGALDIVMSHDLPAWTPYLPSNKTFRPNNLGYADAGCIFPVRSLSRWYGSQCLLLRRDVCKAILDLQGDWCADMGCRKVLLRMGLSLYSVYPNLVQHRPGPSSWLSSGKRHQSDIFYLDWLPGWEAWIHDNTTTI